MNNLLILLALVIVTLFMGTAQCGLLSRLLLRETSTTSTTEQPTHRPLFINNNVPEILPGCTAQFECKKRLTKTLTPYPCVKYCLKRVSCPNEQTRGKSNECVELDEEVVLEELQEERAAATYATASGAATEKKIMQVAMIDFPCQPGYLPDSRGRCRQVW